MPRRRVVWLVLSVRSQVWDQRRSDENHRLSNGPSRCVLARCDRLRIPCGETLPPIVGNGTVYDGAAVNAFPRVEDEEEIGEAFQHHEAFALRAFHRILPGGYVHSCRRNQARPAPNCRDT